MSEQSADQLKAEIEGPVDDKLDFQCDLCEQHYYDSDDVDSESVFFGEAPEPRTVQARSFQPKGDREMGRGRYGQPQVLGKPADELAALLTALDRSDRFELSTARRVYEPEPEFVEDPDELTVTDYDENVNDDIVGATVTAEPRPSRAQPAASICEYCVETIKHD